MLTHGWRSLSWERNWAGKFSKSRSTSSNGEQIEGLVDDQEQTKKGLGGEKIYRFVVGSE